MGYSVYKIRNLINGKIYIGKSKNTKIRFQAHIRGDGKYKNKHYSLISKAISKYGLDNFEFEILKTFDDPEEMNKYELEMITEYDSVSPSGYNLRSLIDNKYTVHENTKKLLSDIGQGIRHANKENILSEYVGVVPYNDKFRTFIRIKTTIKSKTFNSEIAAAEAYDKMVLFLHGETAKLNFYDKRLEYLSSDLEDFYNTFLSSHKTSKFIGVSKYRHGNKWVVKLDKSRHPNIPPLKLGLFDCEIEAAKTYDIVMRCYHTKSKLNFPNDLYSDEYLSNFVKDKQLIKKSKYKGVTKNTKNDFWRAYVYVNNKQITIGSSFHTEEDAHKAILQYGTTI